ncbi:hypothetical protein ABEB36_000118 [Hypothenemus hampei]|uniref:Uncharacterized protein n=1 Tax=Hypothenemus hampei TaxID=57062 RepID=A0ABD1FAA3_HYPHA
MDSIFQGKKNIKPAILLSTDTIDHLEEETEPIQSTSGNAQTLGKSSSLKRKWPIKVEKEKVEVAKKKESLMSERN